MSLGFWAPMSKLILAFAIEIFFMVMYLLDFTDIIHKHENHDYQRTPQILLFTTTVSGGVLTGMMITHTYFVLYDNYMQHCRLRYYEEI